LGYWLTPVGLKPWSKKIKAILNMERPQNISQLHAFIGAFTFYCDMWPHRSHILAPLAELTGQSHLVCTEWQQQAFDTIKALISEDALLHYPDHNLPFTICTNASDYQLGSIILQGGIPVA
jgi:hypothetical protein